jgi:hypothetical protein
MRIGGGCRRIGSWAQDQPFYLRTESAIGQWSVVSGRWSVGLLSLAARR